MSTLLNSAGYRLDVNVVEIEVGIINAKERLQAEAGTTETATDGVVERLDGTGSELGEDTSGNAQLLDAKQSKDRTEAIFAIAFWLKDPCGPAEIKLARALLRFCRVLPEKKRLQAAELVNEAAATLERLLKG